MIKDLTQGKPTKVLLGFCIPLLISAVFQQLYNMADSIIAGKVLGESALAAVGASYPETGGKNVSGLHWDLIKNMKNGGKIFADDILIYENGKFII